MECELAAVGAVQDEAPPKESRMTMRPEPYQHLEDERIYAGLDELELK